MIDAASALVLAPVDVATALELLEEVVGPVAPRGSTEGQILTGHKVAGVRGDDVEETGFGFRVAKSLQSGDMVVSDFHRLNISAVSSRWSRTRRKRSASPRGT
jgi:hypothetical protein